jgi:hypothetical protein
VSRQKWEYMKYWWNSYHEKDMWQDLDDCDIDPYENIDDAGLDGWELVAVNNQGNQKPTVLIFKRPVEENQ